MKTSSLFLKIVSLLLMSLSVIVYLFILYQFVSLSREPSSFELLTNIFLLGGAIYFKEKE